MSPLFDEQDSPWKRIAIIFGWIVIALIALRIVGFLVTDVLPVILGFGLIFGPAMWVFWHAHTHGVSKPFLWALLALVTWVIGLVVYLIVNTGNGKKLLCPTCGLRVEKDYAVCPGCGADLRTVGEVCQKCGAPRKSGWRFCAACGAELSSPPEGALTEKT